MPKRRRHRDRSNGARASGPPTGSHTAAGAPSETRAASNGTGIARSPIGSAGVWRISAPSDAEQLAGLLLDPQRGHPVVVVSIPSGQSAPWIDPTEIHENVRGLADVVLLPTDESSWALSTSLPEMTQVYGGAGRVYPVGLDWTTDPYRSPLRFAYSSAEGAPATQKLISDALGMARSAGVTTTTAPVTTVSASGTVLGLVQPSRALVKLDDGSMATIWQELTAPDVAIERLVRPGQSVSGLLDPDTRRLDISQMLIEDVSVPYGRGDTVLTQVNEVRPDVVHLALLPGLVVPVPATRVTGNDADTLTSLFTIGEVVIAHVASVDDAGLMLRLDDVDDDEVPVEAPALVAGGPPWLSPPQDAEPDLAAESPPSLAPVELSPQPSPPLATTRPPSAARSLSISLDAAKAEITRLETELNAIRGLSQEVVALRLTLTRTNEDYQRLHNDHAALKTHLRHHKTGRSTRAKAEELAPSDEGPFFTEPSEQFDFEVRTAWVRRIPPAEKAVRPLAAYRLHPDFLPSLEALQGVARSKVVDVVVEVLTGLAEQLAGRQLHELRSGSGPGDPQVRREDGFTAWRVSLQVNTPSARRLHYWRRGNEYELWRVGVHDDL